MVQSAQKIDDATVRLPNNSFPLSQNSDNKISKRKEIRHQIDQLIENRRTQPERIIYSDVHRVLSDSEKNLTVGRFSTPNRSSTISDFGFSSRQNDSSSKNKNKNKNKIINSEGLKSENSSDGIYTERNDLPNLKIQKNNYFNSSPLYYGSAIRIQNVLNPKLFLSPPRTKNESHCSLQLLFAHPALPAARLHENLAFVDHELSATRRQTTGFSKPREIGHSKLNSIDSENEIDQIIKILQKFSKIRSAVESQFVLIPYPEHSSEFGSVVNLNEQMIVANFTNCKSLYPSCYCLGVQSSVNNCSNKSNKMVIMHPNVSSINSDRRNAHSKIEVFLQPVLISVDLEKGTCCTDCFRLWTITIDSDKNSLFNKEEYSLSSTTNVFLKSSCGEFLATAPQSLFTDSHTDIVAEDNYFSPFQNNNNNNYSNIKIKNIDMPELTVTTKNTNISSYPAVTVAKDIASNSLVGLHNCWRLQPSFHLFAEGWATHVKDSISTHIPAEFVYPSLFESTVEFQPIVLDLLASNTNSVDLSVQESLLVEDILFCCLGVSGEFIQLTADYYPEDKNNNNNRNAESCPLPVFSHRICTFLDRVKKNYQNNQNSCYQNNSENVEWPFTKEPFHCVEDLDESVAEMAAKVLGLVHQLRTIRFVAQHHCESPSLGRVSEAFGCALQKFVFEFETKTISIGQDSNSDFDSPTPLTLQRLWMSLYSAKSSLDFLSRVASDCYGLKGGVLINALYSLRDETASNKNLLNISHFLLTSSLAPIESFFSHWVLRGEVQSDPFNEMFLVSDSRISITKNSRPPRWANLIYWGAKFAVDYSQLPVCLKEVEKQVLLAGKCWAVLKECHDSTTPEGRDEINKLFQNVPFKILSFESSDFVDELESVAFIASSKLYEHVMNKCKLLSRLETAKKFFFLSRSDWLSLFFDRIMQTLMDSAPPHLDSIAAVLSTCIMNSSLAANEHSKDIQVAFSDSLLKSLVRWFDPAWAHLSEFDSESSTINNSKNKKNKNQKQIISSEGSACDLSAAVYNTKIHLLDAPIQSALDESRNNKIQKNDKFDNQNSRNKRNYNNYFENNQNNKLIDQNDHEDDLSGSDLFVPQLLAPSAASVWSALGYLASPADKKLFNYFESGIKESEINLTKDLIIGTSSENSKINLLTLQFNVPWPLSLIFSTSAMMKYQLIFRLLLFVKFIQLRLSYLWRDQSKTCKELPLVATPSLTSALLIRKRMFSFSNDILHYITHEVIEVQSTKFFEELVSVNRIDQFLELHSKFLNCCLTQCFLTSSQVIRLLLHALHITELFLRHASRFSDFLLPPSTNFKKNHPFNYPDENVFSFQQKRGLQESCMDVLEHDHLFVEIANKLGDQFDVAADSFSKMMTFMRKRANCARDK